MNKWFINSNDYIKGPFEAEEVQQHIRSLGDEIQKTFLWSRGHSEWIRADRWSPDVVPAQTKSTDSSFTPSSPGASYKADMVDSIKSNSLEKYRVQYDYVDKGEMTKEELTQFTAKQEDVSKISIFDKNSKEWKEIYTLPDIVQRLGITRRQHQRVPILAQFNGIHTTTGAQISARVITISAGGMGITDNFELKLGESIQGQLSSPHFFAPISITAEVTYAGLDGYVGLKFVNASDEVMALVQDYIKRFGKDAGES
jgi:hypothetical protein